MEEARFRRNGASPRSPSEGEGKGSIARHSRSDRLPVPLVELLGKAREQAAFKYLFQETSLDSIRECLLRIRDQELSLFVQDGILQIATLMSSEAFTGLELLRRDLKALKSLVSTDPPRAKALYDRYAENLGQYVFALSRKLDQLEVFLSGCPFTGSAELIRGRYGQRVRDLAGDIRFLRVELNRWVERFVPFRGELPSGDEGRYFLEGRIGAVVDDLGLRLKELQEVLSSAIHYQLVLFDESLTRGKLFKGDIENYLDTDHLLNWFSELMSRVKEYDERRRPEQLDRVKTLLRDFRPEEFPALAGIRDSDHTLFAKFVPEILEYRHSDRQGDDTMHVFLLLLGDLLGNLEQAVAKSSPFDPDF